MALSATGLGTGLDISGIVEQLVAAERAPTNNRLNLQEARANAELSGLGKFKSALTTFQDSLTNLSKLENFQQRTATVGDSTIFSATVTSDAVPSTYGIEVTNLAASNKLVSGAIADVSTAVGTGNLAFTVNGETNNIAISAPANTLADIRDAINNATDNPGVLATVVTAADGAHLVLTSKDTGASNEITVVASGGDGGLSAFDWDAVANSGSMSELQAGVDAAVVIDGFAVTSASNTLAGAIEGVTINLLDADPGVTNNLQIGLNEAAAGAAVGAFVNAYNELISTIGTLTSYNAETGESGVLLGDVATRSIKSSLRREITAVVADTGASFSTLAEIGITTETGGTLVLDSTKLTELISSDFDAVGNLFAKTDTGIATRIDTILTSVLSDAGSIETREDTLQVRLDRIKDQRVALDMRIEDVHERLLRQYNAMDSLVSQLNNTSNYLTIQLSQLPTFKQSS